MSVAEAIKSKLTDALKPASLDIIDESDMHKGHAGHDGQGESHFSVTVVASAFEGKSRVQRQRLVYGILAEELDGRVHALSLKTLTPADLPAAK